MQPLLPPSVGVARRGNDRFGKACLAYHSSAAGRSWNHPFHCRAAALDRYLKANARHIEPWPPAAWKTMTSTSRECGRAQGPVALRHPTLRHFQRFPPGRVNTPVAELRCRRPTSPASLASGGDCAQHLAAVERPIAGRLRRRLRGITCRRDSDSDKRGENSQADGCVQSNPRPYTSTRRAMVSSSMLGRCRIEDSRLTPGRSTNQPQHCAETLQQASAGRAAAISCAPNPAATLRGRENPLMADDGRSRPQNRVFA
jgi:hypothetical protein